MLYTVRYVKSALHLGVSTVPAPSKLESVMSDISEESVRHLAGLARIALTDAECNAIDQALLSDPQTSGGLLVACTPESVDEVLAVFHQHGFTDACEVGEITPASTDGIKLQVR